MSSDGKLISIENVRREKQEQVKREYERVLFRNILGCYTMIERLGLKSVEMVDISKSGLSFRMPVEDGAFTQEEELDFRFYFSQKAYLPTRVCVKRVTPVIDQGRRYNQFGCTFDTALSSQDAINRFVEFIEAFSKSAKEDKGDQQVWFL